MPRSFHIIKYLILAAISSLFFATFIHAEQPKVPFTVEVLTSGLDHPWSMAFLPDGRIMITERAGRLRIVMADGSPSEPTISGLPNLLARDQGGLLGIALDPDFARNQQLYFSYAEQQGNVAGTAVARAKLVGNQLKNVQVIFRQLPKTEGTKHFGSRLVVAPNGNLFVTLGDRFTYMDQAQHLDNHIGKLIRIRKDGSVPTDNPFAKHSVAKPEIWSYGHRHIQGAAIHPGTGVLWIHEHGPRGGDEINIPLPGKNYGWPLASYGMHYSMEPIKDEHAEQGFEEPIYYWNPSIAPSGMMFYRGNLFPEWKGNLFIGSLVGRHLVRLVVDSNQVISEEKLLMNQARIRDVAEGPDGAIYLLTDDTNGLLLKLSRPTP
ncbi:MAG TPA: PQQ-dependent sugar dehydrogenase [Nitrosomonas sp.]|nr:PQQ-dependent sugar dehydrogenase [Nitrosomonas sp.]HMW19430.1 PQQ-dependent sugar dehydrogenase [Nitrosomonas sp.]HMW69566.1 PQQ-dependent sugar dehydrogenase [Nitrosomonas sp.]HMY61228.1 PQQ-dependent sugar dehydrogenase [Nitrosomonas sp.]HMY90138.1 PQQ-dependent sugar dehydrogenase [Nitrosomonas sp.]